MCGCFCLAWGCCCGCGFTADRRAASVKVQVGWSLSVCVCMASAYSRISSWHISQNPVDMCVHVVDRAAVWFLFYFLFDVCVILLCKNFVCVNGWSGLCSLVVIKQLSYVSSVLIVSLWLTAFFGVLFIDGFASLNVEWSELVAQLWWCSLRSSYACTLLLACRSSDYLSRGK